MVKVVGKDPLYIHEVSCINCASKLQYIRSEVKTKQGSDYSGDSWYYDVIDCPECGKDVEV